MKRAIQVGVTVLVAFIGASAISLWQADQRAPLISRSQFASQLDAGNVKSVGIVKGVAYVDGPRGEFSRFVAPDDNSPLLADLQRRGVRVGVHNPKSQNLLTWLTRFESRVRFGS